MIEEKDAPLQLSQKGIQKMTCEIQQQLLLQVINFKNKKSSRICCELSDGVHKIRAYISEASQIKQQDEGAIIEVNAYGLIAKNAENSENEEIQEKRPKIMGVLVHICKIVKHYDGVIGNPVDILQNGEVVSNYEKEAPIVDLRKMGSNGNSSKKNNGPIEKLESKNNKITLVVEEEQPNEEDIENSQKIEDLYTDLANWQIIAKITKKQYKQFYKAGQGKLIKLLSLELMDSTGMKIGGTIFGDVALEFNNALEEDQVYRISRGQIRQDTYNANKNIQNHSKYTIMFTRNSQFKKIHNQLPQFNTGNRYKTLSQILENPRLNQEYDIKTIIIGIEDQVQIQKQVKKLIKQNIQLYDPIKNVSLEAVIWNRSIKLDDKPCIGRVVALTGWRLGRFNDKWSFNSGYNSELKILEGSKRGNYAEYDSNLDTSDILAEQNKKAKEMKKQLSKNQEAKDEFNEEEIRYLKDIEEEVLSQNKEVKSTVNVFVSFLGYKKWYYDSCPHCRKSAEPQSKCVSCEKVITQTIPKYKLNVELNDFSGSVWATGFEQLGQKLFSDLGKQNHIKYLQELDENERKAVFEQRYFKEFIIKLTSRLDRDGTSVKHTINRVLDINVASRIDENFKRIRKALEP